MASEKSVYTVEELIKLGVLYKPLDGNHGGIHPKGRDFVDSGIPFVMASDLSHGLVDTKTCKFISENQASTLRKGFSITGDVLISHKATIGRTAIVGEIESKFIVLTPQVTYYRVKDTSKLNNKYLKYYFDSYEFQSLLNQWAGGGSTRAYLGITGQLKLPIKVLDIKDQKAIAHILGTLDDKIELNRQMNATLEAMAQALFKSWFVDFDPVIDNALAHGKPIPEAFAQRAELRKSIENKDNANSAEIRALFPDEFEINEDVGWIPKGWTVDSLLSIIELIGGGTPKTSIAEYWNGDIPWFSVVDAPSAQDVFVLDTEKHITQLGLEKSSTKILPIGTTIISARGTVGKCAMVSRPITMNQSCYGIRGSNGFADIFTYYSILLNVSVLQNRGHGSVFNTITKDTFKSIKVAFSNSELTKEFDNIAKPYFDKILANGQQQISLAKLRDTLLPKLMSGELRIADAEKLVNNVENA